MAIEKGSSPIEENGRETQIYMDSFFPILCYNDDLNGYDVPWHWHDELELLIVTEGEIVAAEEQEEYVIKKGDGFFVNSGFLHAMWNKNTGPCRIHSMVFSTRLLSGPDLILYEKYIAPVLRNSSIRSIVFSQKNKVHKRILEKIEQAWELCRDEPEGYEWEVRNLLSEVIFLIWKNMPETREENHVYEVRRERIKQMLIFLQENYMNPVTLDDLAQQASISESEVIRCFSSVLKTTPIQFLKDYRMTKGAELLKSTNDSVTSIAGRCGFADTSYFIRSFNKKYGCTPGMYRKK
jgi:AraC-like DNA-binding protein